MKTKLKGQSRIMFRDVVKDVVIASAIKISKHLPPSYGSPTSNICKETVKLKTKRENETAVHEMNGKNREE